MAGEPPQANSPQEFAAVVEAHWTSVYRLAFHMAGHRHDADELTQETFLKALERWQSYTPGTNLRAWLLRIATNLFLDERRKRKRRNTGSLPEDVAGGPVAPERGLELKEQAELVRAAMEELSETTRLVFHLRTTEDLSFREIGESAGLTEEAARWHMHQARVRLMKRLHQDESENE